MGKYICKLNSFKKWSLWLLIKVIEEKKSSWNQNENLRINRIENKEDVKIIMPLTYRLTEWLYKWLVENFNL